MSAVLLAALGVIVYVMIVFAGMLIGSIIDKGPHE